MGIQNNIYFSLTLVCLWNLYSHSYQTSQCEVIRIPMCMSMQWNLTHMPNIMGHSSQQNALLKITDYQPLVSDRCSSHLQFFICALFAPICTSNFLDNPIPPCREVCEEVKRDCGPVIENKYNSTWPVEINCNQFPQYDNGVCVSPQAIRPETNSQLAGPSNSSAQPIQKSCNCRKKTKFHIRRYVQASFDYVIRAAVEGTRQIGQDLIISLNIKKILKNQSSLRLRKDASLILWAEGNGCKEPCPSVRARKQYIIACSEIVNNTRLMFDTNTCMIARWKDKWEDTIENWDNIAELPENTRNSELRRRRHMKKGTDRLAQDDSPTQS